MTMQLGVCGAFGGQLGVLNMFVVMSVSLLN